MRLGLLAWTPVLVLLAGSVGAAAAPSEENLPPPIATRQTLFSIPFQVDQAQRPSQQPVEIRLYVSTDRGAHWQICDRVKPEKNHFLFRAVTDGEYWFLIRTVDRSGQVRPQRADRPGLRVVVDTTLPDLKLDASRGEAGEIVLRWQVTDAHLDPDKLKIQYRSAPERPWRTVAIDHRNVQTSGLKQKGKVTWWPESGSHVVEIRAEVADTADNWAVSHATVSLDRNAGADPAGNLGPELRGAGQPPASEWRHSDESSMPASQEASSRSVVSPQNAITADMEPTGDLPPARSPQGRYPEAGTAGKDLPDARHGETDYAGMHSAQVSDPMRSARVSDPVRSARVSDPAETRAGAASETVAQRGTDFSGAGLSGPHDPTAWPPTGSLAASTSPPIRNQYVAPQGAAPDWTAYGLPPGEQPQMVNSRLFELEYHVDSVGPSGIGRVELWGTGDGGRTWTSFGVDPDGQSPVLVTVERDGIYGFRVAVQNGAGLGGEKPQSHDRPDVWVGVDATKPEARIVSAKVEPGDPTPRLVIQWTAQDALLAARPVSLLASETPTGPWTEIASGLENTGSYAWPLEGRLPLRVYLRLEVRDEAQNVAHFDSAHPVALDPLRPTVRIRKVRPVVETARSPSGAYRARN